MPTSLLTAAARLQSAGVDVRWIDENIEQTSPLSRVIGVNVIGAPYVLRVVEIMSRLQAQHKDGLMLLGGQGVTGFSDEQRHVLWGRAALDGNSDATLISCLHLDPHLLPAPEETSLVPIYEGIPEHVMRTYLSHEFGFYLSQGCKFQCTFCAADRSGRDPNSGTIRLVRERYRRSAVVADDLQCLISRARQIGLPTLKLYLSNLDLFQNPQELSAFASTVSTLRRANDGFQIEMRGLSTTTSFLQAHRYCPSAIEAIVAAGLFRLGFGIDGATRDVWRAIKKPQRSVKCLEAIRIAKRDYGLQPEALMVFGHPLADDAASLQLATDVLRKLKDELDAIPRPHVAKSIVPGNDGWKHPANAPVVEYLMKHPQAFQMLDFTALPSWLTHRDPDFRAAVSAAFVAACSIRGSKTQYVRPEDPELSADQLRKAREFNLRRYDV
jgi:hypothetical protein